MVEEDTHKGLEYLDQVTKIAEEVTDYLSWWTVLYQSGCLLAQCSQFTDAHKHEKQCLDFSLLAKNPMGTAFSKGAISNGYAIEGKINLSYEFAQETLKLANETGDAFIKGMAYSIYGAACYNKGLFNEAKTYLLEWDSFYERSTPVAWITLGYCYLGLMYSDLREYDNAVNCYNKVISILENASFLPSWIRLFQSCLIRTKVLRHDQDIDLSELFACYENYKVTFCKGWTARNIGDVLLNIDNNHLADAEIWFQKAIEDDMKNGFRWQVAMDHACYANWFKKKGDMQGAKEQLTKSIDIFRECGADGWVEKYEKELVLIS
jgi:tetratricopeptide (TPR) repeat protein